MEKVLMNILRFGGIFLLLLISMTGCNQDKNNTQAKKPYLSNVAKEAINNDNFRKVIYTGEKSQLVLMSLKPGEDIGEETHKNVEQTIFLYSGSGKVVLNGVESPFKAGDILIITAGTKHNIINTGKTALKIFTVYIPPNHIDGIVHKTKKDAEQDSADENFSKQVNESKRIVN